MTGQQERPDNDPDEAEVTALPGLISSRRTAGTVTSLEIIFDDRVLTEPPPTTEDEEP